MRKDQASLTAKLVASFRGVAPDPDRPGQRLDPWAAKLLPPAWGCWMRPFHGVLRVPVIHQVYNAAFACLPDHVELRTRTIDGELRALLQRGGVPPQLVILGAGFDARALRMRELATLRVFEVDHPDTQKIKLAAIQAQAPQALAEGCLVFVGVDFTVDDLGERLQAAGHDPAVPTVWLWEGVTPYLPLEATQGTLHVVAARSAPGSAMIVTYCRRRMSNVRAPERAHGLFRRLGEPLLGLIDDPEILALLAQAGFGAAHHTGMRDWARTAGWWPPRVVIEERVLVAANHQGG